MSDDLRQSDLHQSGARIEQLLEEIRGMAGRPAWQRVEELVGLVVELYGAGLAHIVALVGSEANLEGLRTALLQDELVSSLLILHGIHPEDVRNRISRALEKVRPYLGSHGGDVELVQVDAINGRVKLRLGGNCDGCASSMATVKLAVESAIHELAPEITGIEVDGLPNEAAPKSFINSNGHSKQPSWMPLGHETPQKSGELATAEVTGERILLCRVGKHLYAYRELCPACGSPIGSTALDGEILSCASCEERYNVRFAGRALGRRELHLDPVPLLENDLGVKVALPGVAL